MQRKLGFVIALVASSLALTTPARAQEGGCPEGAIRNAIGARVDGATLQAAAPAMLDFLPPSFAIPPQDIDLFSCGGGLDASLSLGDINLSIPEVHDLDVNVVDGRVEVMVRADVEADTDVDISLCEAPVACDAHALLRSITISGVVVPSVNECRLDLQIENVDVDVASDDVEVSLGECPVFGELLNLVLAGFQDLILHEGLPALETFVVQEVPELIGDAAIDIVLPSFSALGMAFDLAPQSLSVEGDSVVAVVMARARPDQRLGLCVPPDTVVEPGPSPASVPFVGGGAGAELAVSEEILQNVVSTAWAVGWVCQDTALLGLDLRTVLEPIFPGADVQARIDDSAAPTVFLDPGGLGDIVLEFPYLRASIDISLPPAPPIIALAEIGARMSARLVIDPSTTSVAVEPVSLEPQPALITLPGSAGIPISGEGLQQLFDKTLSPLLFGSAGRLPVASNLIVDSPVAIRLDRVDAAGGFLNAGLELFPKDRNDTSSPLTGVSSLPASPSPAELGILTASFDDHTPPGFMRHIVLVDGVAEPGLRAGQRLSLAGLLPGRRFVAVQAVDLNDNMGTVSEFEVLVDSVAPSVTLEGPSPGVHESTSLELTVSAVDDFSASADMEAWFQLHQMVDDGGESLLLREGTLSLGKTYLVDNLPEDEIVMLNVFVKDEAGNVGEGALSMGINADPSTGCHALPHASLLWCFGAIALLRRRYRTR